MFAKRLADMHISRKLSLLITHVCKEAKLKIIEGKFVNVWPVCLEAIILKSSPCFSLVKKCLDEITA